MQECKIVFNTPDKFAGKGLVSSHLQLNKDLTVMDGIINSNGLDKCAVVVLNISHQIVQIPYHLKEVAIAYVDKLLRSGVVRPSTLVFDSPLMLVKKPNSKPDRPLAEPYKLVHNYVELNKNIAPCSYPLRHLYELLDEVPCLLYTSPSPRD